MNAATAERVENRHTVRVLRTQLEAAHDAIERLIVERDAALERVAELEGVDVTDLLEEES